MTKPPPADSRSSTRLRRVIAGLVILGLFLPLVWADRAGAGGAGPAAWLLPVALTLAAGSGLELTRVLAVGGIAPRAWILVGGMVAMPLVTALADPAFRDPGSVGMPFVAVGAATLGLLVAVAAAFVAEIATYRPGGGALPRLAATALGLTCVGLPLSFLVALRLVGVPDYVGGRHPPGLLPLVTMIAAVKSGDVAAYLVGSTLGSRRMAPLLSPGKTWEGLMGSFAGALLGSWACLVPLAGMLAGPDGVRGMPLGGWIVHGLAVGSAGVLGDLAESLLKRDAGVKDSGTTLGALGGVLDLVDSLLWAAPVAWLLWVFAYPY